MIFLSIVFLAAFFRITFLSTIEFKTDESIALFLASRPLFGHPFPPGSTVSSFGILNPPLFVYLLFPFTLISFDPKIISGSIGLINAITIGFFYLFVKKYYDKHTALFGSLLLAVSPWSIIFSRKIWAQDLVFPFIVIVLYSLHKILVDKKPTFWIPYILFTLFLLQLYPPTVFFLFILTVLLLFKKPHMDWKYSLFAFLIGLVPLFPYFFFEIQNKFHTIFSIFHAGDKISYQNHASVFIRPLQILNQGNFYQLFGDDMALFAKEFPILYSLKSIFYVEYLILIGGALLFYWRHKTFRFLLYTSLLLPFLYFLFRITPEMHYFIILTPVLFLFIGTFFSYTWSFNTFTKLITRILFVCFIGISIAYNFAFFTFLKKQARLQGTYGTIFEVNERLTKSALEKYKDTKEYNEMLLTSYIPYNFLTGDKIVSKMIFDFEETKKNIKMLDERVKKIPEDARVYNQLLAFYTSVPPTKTVLKTLREKSARIPSYYAIYRTAYNIYLQNTFRKEYQSSEFGFAFEYPEHWKITTDKKRVLVLNGDGYLFTFKTVQPPCDSAPFCTDIFSQINNQTYSYTTTVFFDQKIQHITCADQNGIWCGSLYGPFQSNENEKSVIFVVQAESQNKKDFSNVNGLIHIILSTLRKL